MSRVLLLSSLLVTVALARGDADAAYAAARDSATAYAASPDSAAGAAPVPVPYPYAQAQKDSYAADAQYLQQQPATFEGGYYPPSSPVYPEFALAAAKAEAVAVAVKAASWVVSHVAATALGSLLALAVCKLTPLCSLLARKWHHADSEDGDYSRALAEPALRALKAAVAKYAPKKA